MQRSVDESEVERQSRLAREKYGKIVKKNSKSSDLTKKKFDSAEYEAKRIKDELDRKLGCETASSESPDSVKESLDDEEKKE
jgi:hypothetical protein